MMKKGSKISESYKGATAEGTNVDLVGSLVLADDKTLSFNGTIYSKNKSDIGRFEYNNPDGTSDPTMMIPGSFRQTVTITDKEYSVYQEEATKLLADAVVDFAKPIVS